ncbi:MAG: anaerobic ribonucleoside-triphosphate reductase activating protein [Cellulosilyticaceae bacterium]
MAGFLDHSTVNGEGFRTTLFLSGCRHGCPGCHNPETQAFDYGEALPLGTLLSRIKKNLPLIDGVTLSGGDPFEQADAVYILLTQLKALHLSVWIYTGYTYEALLKNPSFAKLLPLIDVLVDGPYVASMHTDTLRYIGSSNQRILKLTGGKITEVLHFK